MAERIKVAVLGATGSVGQRFVLTDPQQRPMGTVGPLSDEALVYQVGASLLAADGQRRS